ncbi:14391_t:CDS:2, partial [Gigaspora margarita]
IKLYFDQSHKEKLNYKINKHYYGYIDLRQELLDFKNQKIGNHKESFNFTIALEIPQSEVIHYPPTVVNDHQEDI